MLGLAVHLGNLHTIKYLVTECSVNVHGEQPVYVIVLLSVVSVSTCTHVQQELIELIPRARAHFKLSTEALK